MSEPLLYAILKRAIDGSEMTPMRFIIAGVFSLLLAPLPLLADGRPVVVELFTSQGCSSCPPADEILEELARHPDVIALAMHVDYWDYLGWRDTFGSAVFTTRQQNYAAAAGSHTVYTPQFVIGGVDHVVGAKPMAVMDGIQDRREAFGGPELTVRQDAAGVVTLSAPAMTGHPMMRVQVATYIPRRVVRIGRGENAGREMTYVNIVDSWSDLGGWDGSAPLDMSIPLAPHAHGAVVLQVEGAGPIVAAQSFGNN